MSDINIKVGATLNLNEDKRMMLQQIKNLESEIKPIKIKLEIENLQETKRLLQEINSLQGSSGNGGSASGGRNNQRERNRLVEDEVRNRARVLTLETQLMNIRNRYNRNSFDRDSGQFRELESRYRNLISLVEQYRNRRESMSSAERLAVREQIRDLNQLSGEFTRTQREMARSVRENSASFRQLGDGMESAGNAILKLSAPLIAATAIGVKSQIEFESAFAGIRKTVDATEEQFQQLEKGVIDMSKRLPQSASDISKVGESAGQLGIATESVLDFTEVMIKLGDSTNLSSTDAANELARLANITQMPQTEFERLGSTIVELGNNLATTEDSISEMALRLAGAGKQIGISEAEILSFAGALSSLGIKADMGGSAFSKIMVNLQLAVEEGGENLEQFGNVAGMTGKQFQEAFKLDPSKAIISFIEGIGDVEKNGQSAIKTLADLDIKEVRLRDTMLRAAGASNVLAESLEMGTRAWNENTALNEEASKRYETTESQLKMMKNQLVDVARNIGEMLLPNLVKLSQFIVDVTNAFSRLNPQTQSTMVKIGLLAAGFGGILRIGGSMVKTFGGIAGVLSVASQAMTTTTGVVNVMGMSFQAASIKLAMLTFGLTAVAGIAVGAIASHAAKQEEQKREIEGLVDSIDSTVSNHNVNIKSLSGLKNEYSELNKKLGENRDFTKLTADEQQRYNGIVEQLTQISPNIVTGYDEQGNAIIDYKTSVEDLIEKEKELIGLQNQKLIAGTSDIVDQMQEDVDSTTKKKEQLKREMDEINEILERGTAYRANKKTGVKGWSVLDDEDKREYELRLAELSADLKVEMSEMEKISEQGIELINGHFARLGDTEMSSALKDSFQDIIIEMYKGNDDKIGGVDAATNQIKDLTVIYDELKSKADEGLEIDIEDTVSAFEELGFGFEESFASASLLHGELSYGEEVLKELENSGLSTANAMEVMAMSSDEATHATGLLSQAQEELKSNGEISRNTLDKLIQTYPYLTSVTDMSRDAQLNFISAIISAAGAKNQADVAMFESAKKNAMSMVRIYMEAARAAAELAKSMGAAISVPVSLAAKVPTNAELGMRDMESEKYKSAVAIARDSQINAKANKAKQEAYEALRKAQAAQSAVSSAEAKINSISATKVNPPSGGNSSYKPSSSGGKKPTSKSGGTSKQDPTAEADRYYLINTLLEQNNNLLKDNQSLQEQAEDDTLKRLRLVDEEIRLNKEHQKFLHIKNIELRKEASELQKSLSGVFNFDGSLEGNNLKILNPEALEGKSTTIEEKYKRLVDIVKELPKASQEWLNINNKIADLMGGLDKHTLLKGNISDIDSKLEYNKNKQSTTEDKREIVELQKQEIELYKQKQKELHSLANLHRTERDSYMKALKEGGVEFTGEGDNARIANPEKLKELNKEYTELAERFNEKQFDKIPVLSNSWFDEQSNIVAITKTRIDRLKELSEELEGIDFSGKQEELQAQLEQAKYDYKIELTLLESDSFDKTVQLMRDKLNFLHEDDLSGRIDVVGDMFDTSSNRTKQLADEMDRLRSIIPKNKQEADSLVNAIQSVRSQMKNSTSETRELQRQLDMLNLDNLTKSFKDADKQLEQQLTQINHNLSMIQDGVLIEDMSLDTLLPIPDFTDAFVDIRSESEKQFDDQVDIETQIQDLKKYSMEIQLEESEKYYDEEMRKLEEHYEKVTQKIFEATMEIAQLKENMTPNQLQDLQEVNSEIQQELDKSKKAIQKEEEDGDKKLSKSKKETYAEILSSLYDKWLNPEEDAQRDHTTQIMDITTGFLYELQNNYADTWGGIVGTVQSSVSAIISSVNQTNSAVSNMKTPNISSNSGGYNKGSVVSSNSPKVGSDEYRKQNPDIPESIGGGKKGYAKGGVSTEDEIFVGEFGRELLYTPDGQVHVVGEKHAQKIKVPRGTHIVPNEETEKILSKTTDFTSYDGYAKGTEDEEREDEYKREKRRVQESLDMFAEWSKEDRLKIVQLQKQRQSLETKDGISDNELYNKLYQEMKDLGKKNDTDKTMLYNNTSKLKEFIDEDGSYNSEYKKYDKTHSQSKQQNDTHRDRQKENSLVTMSEGFKEEYDKYTEDRKTKLKEISDAQDNLLEGIIPEDEISEFKDSLLSKIDEQLMIDTEMSSKLKIDILGQQKDNSQDYLDELKSEYDNAVSDGKVDLSKEIYQRYNDELQNFNRVNQAINQAIKERYDMQFALIDKQLNKERENQNFLDGESRLSELKDPENYDKQKLIQESKVESEMKSNQIVQDSAKKLAEQMSDLKVGSYEWNVLNNKLLEYNRQLADSNISIEEMKVKIAEIDFQNLLKPLDELEQKAQNLQYELDLKEVLNPDGFEGIDRINDKMISNTQNQIKSLYGVLDSLREQKGMLDINSSQYSVIASQIDDITNRIRSSNIELAKQSKINFSKYTENTSKYIKDNGVGKPSSPIKEKDDSDKWLEGREKELEVEKLMSYIKENNLSIDEKQAKILNSNEKIRKKNLDIVRKELEFQQLQAKLENLKNQKSIQQLKQMDDGTWEFEYVADIDEINNIQDQILDKELEVIRAKKDFDKELQQEKDEAQQDAYNSSQEHYDEQLELLDETLNNAENRIYKSADEFKAALESIGLDLPIDEIVGEYWEYFLETAEIFIREAVDKTKLTLKEKSKEFEEAGNENGKSYVDGLITKIDGVMNGEGDILEKQRNIVSMLAEQYSEFALAGNENGISYMKELINSMSTEDYKLDFNEIGNSISSKLQSQSQKLKDNGQEAGYAYTQGLIVAISEIMENGEIENKTQAVLNLLDKSNEYGTLGQALGQNFMGGMINTFTSLADEVTGEGEGALSGAINSIISQLDTKIVEFSDKGNMQGVAYAEALRVKLQEAMSNAQITQEDIISLLNEYSDFDLAGLLSGEAYGDSLGMEMSGAEGETQESTNAIVSGLNEQVASFGVAGSAQGDAYASAITSALESASTQVQSIIDGLVASISSKPINVNVDVTETVTRKAVDNSNNNIGDVINDNKLRGMASLSTGGRTPSWGDSGKLGILHQNEMIFDKIDTQKILDTVKIANNIKFNMPNLSDIASNITQKQQAKSETAIHINKIELPNVKSGSDAELLVKGIQSEALQYARKG